MKRLLSTWFLIIVPFIGLCQNVNRTMLYGYVLEQSSGRNPVAGVNINSPAANNIQSAPDGSFKLTFAVPAGQNAIINATKAGWMVINDKELSINLPNDPYQRPLKIIMCPSTVFEAKKKEYYKTTDLYIQKQYRSKLAQISHLKTGWQEKEQRLNSEIQKLRFQLEEFADEFSRQNLDDLSQTEKKALALFSDGKISEALELRHSLKSRENLERIKVERQTLNEREELFIRNIKAEVNLYMLGLDFKKAEDNLLYLTSYRPESYDFATELAVFYNRIGNYPLGLQWLKKSLILAGNKAQLAQANENLCQSLQTQNRLNESLSYGRKAAEIYQKLIDEGLSQFVPKLAGTQYKLGNTLRLSGQMGGAAEITLQSVNTFKKLYAANPDTYRSRLAGTIYNLGLIYFESDMHQAAQQQLQSVLDIDDLEDDEVVETLVILGEIELRFHSVKKAKPLFTDAIYVYKKLSQQNPGRYESDLARGYSAMGRLYLEMREQGSDSAKVYFDRALIIFNRYAATDPGTYAVYVAEITNNLGHLAAAEQDYKKAEQYYLDSYKGYWTLAQKEREAFGSGAADAQMNLGTMYMKSGRKSEAYAANRRAVEIMSTLLPNTKNKDDLAYALNSIGYMYFKDEDFDNAVTTLNQALKVYSITGQEKFDQVYVAEFCKTVLFLAMTYKAQGSNSKLRSLAPQLQLAKANLRRFLGTGNSEGLLSIIDDNGF